MKMQTQPLVSVIMPVYNAGSFLVPAIDSILNQTYQNFEFIIVDDASTDDSLTVIRKYQKQYPNKIKLIALKKNRNHGGDRCVNEGLKYAKGKYIARMDADDIAHVTRLQKQVDFLESNTDIFLVGSIAYVIDKNGTIIGDKLEPETPEKIYKSYFTFHPLIHPSCMIRNVYKGKTFSYDIVYSANNDYHTFFTLICKGYKFYNLQEKLMYYRIHGKNDTFVHMKTKYLNTLKIRINMVRKHGYQPSKKAVAIAAIQTAVVFILPEKILTNLYFIAKGIKNKNEILSLFNPLTILPSINKKLTLTFTK
jgi:glycosyltransferase involved in cell wall biosynthesis